MKPPGPRVVAVPTAPVAEPTSPSTATVTPPAQRSSHHISGTVQGVTVTYTDGNAHAWYTPYRRWMTLVDHPLDLVTPLYGPHALDDHPRRFPMARRKRRPADTPGSTTNPLPPPIPKVTTTPNPIQLGAQITIRCADFIEGDQLDLGNGVTVDAVAEQPYTYPAAGTWVIRPLRAGGPVLGATVVAVEVQPPAPPLVEIAVLPAQPVAGQPVTILLAHLEAGDTLDFGDTVSAPAQASQTHLYNAGSYPARVLRGPESVASRLIVVQPANTPAPTPSFELTPRDGTSTQVRTATATAYPPGTRVAWGDGTFTALQGSTALHTYPVGNYVAGLVDEAGTLLPGVTTVSVTSVSPPPPPPPGPSLYEEPTDPWTAYQWNDSVGASSTDAATLVVDRTLLDRYARVATDPFDGIAKWRLDMRDLPSNIRNPRNMVTGRRAIYIKETSRWVWLDYGQAMGVGGGGTSRGIIGSASGARWDATNFSFYGPNLRMVTGQYAGGVKPEGFRHAGLRHVNLERTLGFKPVNGRTGDSAVEGIRMRYVRGRNQNGQIRDTTRASGWKPGVALDVDRVVSNFWQVASIVARYIDIAWNVNEQTPDESYAEDLGNFYNATILNASTYQVVAQYNLLVGAYSMDPTLAYSGGGIIYDGPGCQWLSTLMNFLLETSNYGVAHAGGGHNRFDRDIVLSRGVLPDGRFTDADTDQGYYSRDYYSSADTSGRVITGLEVGFGAPTAGNPNRRQDGTRTPRAGTTLDDITYYGGGSGAIPQAAIDARIDQFWALHQAQNIPLIGRLNP